MNYSEICGKKVVCLSTAECIGTVDGIYIDADTYLPMFISVKNDKSNVLSFEHLLGREDLLTISDKSRLNAPPSYKMYKLCAGQTVLTSNGAIVGKLEEISVGRKYVKLTLDTRSLAPYKITAASDDYIVINNRLGQQKPPIKEPISAIAAQVSEPQKAEEPQAEIIIKTEPLPLASAAQDYSFLLGRHTEKDIADMNNSVYIPSGTAIDASVLEAARKAGKIVDLVLYSSK